VQEFEAERDIVFEVISGLSSEELKTLKRAKSVREGLEKTGGRSLIRSIT
jgi:hypothetical protein